MPAPTYMPTLDGTGVEPMQFSKLVAAMNHIRASGNEWPRIRIELREGVYLGLGLSRDGKAVIARAGDGKVAFMRADGVTFTPLAGNLSPESKRAFWETSKRLARDPLAVLAEQGKRLGWCACCGLPLSNPESVARGIGPECWKRISRA